LIGVWLFLDGVLEGVSVWFIKKCCLEWLEIEMLILSTMFIGVWTSKQVFGQAFMLDRK